MLQQFITEYKNHIDKENACADDELSNIYKKTLGFLRKINFMEKWLKNDFEIKIGGSKNNLV